LEVGADNDSHHTQHPDWHGHHSGTDGVSDHKTATHTQVLVGAVALAVFVVFYVWLYIFMFIFWGVLRDNIDEQLDAYEDYLHCLFLKDTLFGEDACDLKREIAFPLWYIACFVLSTQGIMVFLLFGTSPALWKGWMKVLSGEATFGTGQKTVLSGSKASSQPKLTSANLDDSFS